MTRAPFNTMRPQAVLLVTGLVATFAVTLAAALAPGAATAQPAAYPQRPIRMLVPAAAGGGIDIIARLLGQHVAEHWGQSIVVDNRGGAGGAPAVTMVVKAAPDGYTALLASIGQISFLPALHPSLPYDARRDLAPVSLAASQPFALIAHPSLGAGSLAEMLALAKAKPGTIRYASGGSGAASNLGVELLQHMAGVSLVHVPYKGTAPGATAVIAGEVHVGMVGIATALPYIRSGRTRALAVSGARRADVAPDVPTIAEAGVPGYEFDVWYGMLYPAGTPPAIVDKAAREIARFTATPAVRDRMVAAGLDPVSNSPRAFADLIGRDVARWQKVVKAAGIRAD